MIIIKILIAALGMHVIIAIAIHNVTCGICPKVVNLYPAQAAYNPPIYIDPLIPILNIPTLKETTVAIEVNIYGVAIFKVLTIFL